MSDNEGRSEKDEDHSGKGEDRSGKNDDRVKVIHIVVNEKPVEVRGKDQTGLSVKQAAIAQGVQIQLDFVLSIERGGGKTDLIGDEEPVKVKDGDRFLAIPNDDNS